MNPSESFYFFRPANSAKEMLFVRGGPGTPGLAESIMRTGVDHIVILHWEGDNLGFLTDWRKQIRGLYVHDSKISDISAISSLSGLEDLAVYGAFDQIDFSALKRLRSCGVESRNCSGNLNACESLEDLTLSGCTADDLAWISGLKNLRRLEVQEVPLKSLSGIESLERLQELHIGRGTLKNLKGLEQSKGLARLILGGMRLLDSIEEATRLPALEALFIERCKHIRNLECIGALRSLKRLALNSVGKIASLTFASRLKNLEEATFWEDTNIEDGNMAVLLTLPKLGSVGFRNRRHYSHRAEDINQLLSKNP